MRQNHWFRSLLKTVLNLWCDLVDLLYTEKGISRITPHTHTLENPTPLRSPRLGPLRRAKLSSSLAEYPSNQADFSIWV